MNTALTGDAYIEAMSANEADCLRRRAFQQLAVSLVPPGSAVFDFGCGPGIDAKFYAANGLRVGAYDVDQEMCNVFVRHCESELASGAVQLETGDYRSFLRRRTSTTGTRFRLVTANFAPVNLVPNARELFIKLSMILSSDGLALLSILNPYCVSDMRYRWWWRNTLRLCLHGSYSVSGALGPIRRWLPETLAEQAAPQFVVEALYSDLPKCAVGRSLPGRLRPKAVSDWPAVVSCRFLFLLLKRAPIE